MHVDATVSKAFKMLGFVMRSTGDFRGLNTIIYLFKTLVIPIVMFGSQIWAPYYGVDISKIEAINHRLIRYLLFKNGSPMSYLDHDYTKPTSRFNVYTFKSQFDYNDVLFVKKVFMGLIDSDEIMGLFVRRDIKYDLRFSRCLYESNSKLNYTFYSVVNRLRRLYNVLPPELTLLDNMTNFKADLSLYLHKCS